MILSTSATDIGPATAEVVAISATAVAAAGSYFSLLPIRATDIASATTAGLSTSATPAVTAAAVDEVASASGVATSATAAVTAAIAISATLLYTCHGYYFRKC